MKMPCYRFRLHSNQPALQCAAIVCQITLAYRNFRRKPELSKPSKPSAIAPLNIPSTHLARIPATSSRRVANETSETKRSISISIRLKFNYPKSPSCALHSTTECVLDSIDHLLNVPMPSTTSQLHSPSVLRCLNGLFALSLLSVFGAMVKCTDQLVEDTQPMSSQER